MMKACLSSFIYLLISESRKIPLTIFINFNVFQELYFYLHIYVCIIDCIDRKSEAKIENTSLYTKFLILFVNILLCTLEYLHLNQRSKL